MDAFKRGLGLLGLVALAACSAEEERPGPAGGGAGSAFKGTLTSITGQPLSGVTITAGSASTTSDAQGNFEITVPNGVEVLTFEQPGFSTSMRPALTSGATDVAVEVMMVPASGSGTIDVSMAADTYATSGLSVSFPQDSIETQSGADPSGPVDITVTFMPNSGTTEPEMLPVLLMGQDIDGLWPLESFGMFEITLDCAGEPCDLKSGQLATITFPSQFNDPMTAELFSANPATGIWEVDGAATNDGANWTTQVSHFSWFNIDRFLKVPAINRACVTLRVVDAMGTPIGGAWLVFRRFVNGKIIAVTGHTDRDGTLCTDVAAAGDFHDVRARHRLTRDTWVRSEGNTTVTPSAVGASCGTPACQTVDVTITCNGDPACGSGWTCQNGACVQDPTNQMGTISVTLRNNDSQNIHILTPGENFLPANRITPGASRVINLDVTVGQGVLFRAGRNATVLSTATCVPGMLPLFQASVTYAPGSLLCNGF